uniref:Ig-like domain-containing protein n=1 Tax=Oryzias melastigma TaxID=30732 RepID=A0A3B3BYL5_ORYME
MDFFSKYRLNIHLKITISLCFGNAHTNAPKRTLAWTRNRSLTHLSRFSWLVSNWTELRFSPIFFSVNRLHARPRTTEPKQLPYWSQIFRGETITLTCEVQGGEGVKWEYEWRTPQSQTFRRYYKDWTITASISGEYSCKSRSRDDSHSSTNWSEALRLSVSDDDLILLSPVHPVTEGHSVTLGCKWRTENLLSKVFFYQNDTLIQSESRVEMIIPAVSKSHEGFYKCQSSGKESPQIVLSMNNNSTSRPDSSSLPVLLIVGPVCVFLLMIFPLMFYLYKKSKGEKSQTNQTASYHIVILVRT